MKKMQIGTKTVGRNQPAFIIAEAGVNHNGSFDLAKKLIDAAKDAGADAVKFQTFVTEDHISKNAPLAVYQKENVNCRSQVEMVKKLELSDENFRDLYVYAMRCGIIFLSTPFEKKSVELLKDIGLAAFKIGSGDLTNLPLLAHIAGIGKPMIVSTGMSTMEEVKDAVDEIKSNGNDKIILLHCTSNYPTKIENCNLRIMDTLRETFKVPVGYSDHTKGILIPAIAVAKGACIIEKHFTLDKGMEGPDHRMSLEPQELMKMVKLIRLTEKALGSAEKKPANPEFEVMNVARKSVVARVNLPSGSILKKSMLTIKRPGFGIPPKCLDKLIGKRTIKELREDDVITWEDIEN